MTWYRRISPIKKASRQGRPAQHALERNRVHGGVLAVAEGLGLSRRATARARVVSDRRTAAKRTFCPSRQDDQIDSGWQFGFAESKGFANQPLESVAGVGRADFLPRHRDAQAGVVAAVLDPVDDQHVVGDRAAALEDPAEFRGVLQSLVRA